MDYGLISNQNGSGEDMAKKRTKIREALRNKYATEPQEKKIASLKKKYPYMFVVPHRKTDKYKFHALISLEKRGGFWISPAGRMSAAKPPNPQYFGNIANCVNAGYCTRSIACNE